MVVQAGIIRQSLSDNIKTEKQAIGKIERFLVWSKPPTTSTETVNNPTPKEEEKLSADSIMKLSVLCLQMDRGCQHSSAQVRPLSGEVS